MAEEMNEVDLDEAYQNEFDCLMALQEAGRTDGDGPADIEEIEVIEYGDC